MNNSTDDQTADLKQFIAGLFSQQNAQMEQRFTQMGNQFKSLEGQFKSLEGQFSELGDFVKDAIDITNDANGEQLADHETRITKLEQATI